MKILIIRFSSIGDIVLTTPVVRVLKKQKPNSTIHYLTKPQFFPLLASNPYIDKTILLEKPLRKTIRKLRTEKYDIILDLHHNLRTFIVKAGLLGIRSRSFFKANIGKWLLVNFKINRLPDVHIVDRYLDTTTDLGIQNDNFGLDHFYKNNPNLLAKYRIGKAFIVISLGANHFTKKIPLELLHDIIPKLKYSVVVIGGKDVIEEGKTLEKHHHEILNLSGKLTLDESAQIIDNASLLITSDTGMMHIGAALKRPILSIWGSTVPSFGMVPYYGHHDIPNKIVECKDLSCRPCSKTGHDSCPQKHFKCMTSLSADNIAMHCNAIVQKL